MELNDALRILETYEVDAMFAARSVARRGSNSLLAEGESELSLTIFEGQAIEAMRAIVTSLGDATATRRLWGRYQATCAFYMIDAGRREYESGALYPRIAGELGMRVEQYVNRWADHFIGFLDSIQLQRFHHDSASKYKLESILLHGGLPNDAWAQIWENWILPGIRAGYRDSRQLIEWALSNAHDAPQLRTTTRDILNNGGSVVENLIAEAARAASDAVGSGVVDEAAGYGLPAPALASLESVLSAPRLRWPELVFDIEATGMVFLEVPDIDLGRHGGSEATAMTYDVFETGENAALIKADEAVATNLTGSWRLQGFRVLLQAAQGVEALVRSSGVGRPDQGAQRRIRWRAGPHSVWSFMRDRKGRWVCPPERSWRRPRRDVLYLVPPRMRLACDESNLSSRIVHETTLTDGWAGWTAYQVEGSAGGAIRLETHDGTPMEEWALGQRCGIELEGEDDALVGSLILDRLCPVYGLDLPDLVIDALDPTLVLAQADWSCEVMWRAGSSRRRVLLPASTDADGYRLRVALREALGSLPGLVDDGEIHVRGPEGCGTFKRRFAKVPFARPRLLSIAFNTSGVLMASYEVESDIDLSGGLKNDAVRVSRATTGQRLDAPASLAAVAACVGDADRTVSMNIALAGVSVEAEGVDLPHGEQPLVVPEAALGRLAGAVIRVGVSRGGGCEVSLEVAAPGYQATQVRSIGTEGHYTDALGFSELARVLPTSGDTDLLLKVSADGVIFCRPLFEIPRGLGVGAIRLDRSGAVARVLCERPSAVDLSLEVIDLTAPWRDAQRATLRAGEAAVTLGSVGFPFCEGRYGIWIQIADEWDSGVDLSVAPSVVCEITVDDEPDPFPVMGPFNAQLAQLLRARVNLAEKPRLRARAASPRVHMLEADAEATVLTLLHCLRPMGSGSTQLLEDGETVVTIGRDIMRLDQYRHALSPATLRFLVESASRGWTAADILQAATAMRIPLTDMPRNACAWFEHTELESAWRLHPYLGLVSSRMHSWAGKRDEASSWSDRWFLNSTADSRPDALWHLRTDSAVLRNAAEGRVVNDPSAPFVSVAFVDWLRKSTQREQVLAAQWVRTSLNAARDALRSFRISAGPLAAPSAAIHSRDCGDHVKTISNLPLVSGALALAALALQVGHHAAAPFAESLTGGRRDDPTHEALVELLSQGLERCPDVVGADLFLTGLWWSRETGEL